MVDGPGIRVNCALATGLRSGRVHTSHAQGDGGVRYQLYRRELLSVLGLPRGDASSVSARAPAPSFNDERVRVSIVGCSAPLKVDWSECDSLYHAVCIRLCGKPLLNVGMSDRFESCRIPRD